MPFFGCFRVSNAGFVRMGFRSRVSLLIKCLLSIVKIIMTWDFAGMIFVHKLKTRSKCKTVVLYEFEIVQFPGLMLEKGPIPALTRPRARSCGKHAGQGVAEADERAEGWPKRPKRERAKGAPTC